jgi:hypothetical protein
VQIREQEVDMGTAGMVDLSSRHRVDLLREGIEKSSTPELAQDVVINRLLLPTVVLILGGVHHVLSDTKVVVGEGIRGEGDATALDIKAATEDVDVGVIIEDVPLPRGTGDIPDSSIAMVLNQNK